MGRLLCKGGWLEGGRDRRVGSWSSWELMKARTLKQWGNWDLGNRIGMTSDFTRCGKELTMKEAEYCRMNPKCRLWALRLGYGQRSGFGGLRRSRRPRCFLNGRPYLAVKSWRCGAFQPNKSIWLIGSVSLYQHLSGDWSFDSRWSCPKTECSMLGEEG